MTKDTDLVLPRQLFVGAEGRHELGSLRLSGRLAVHIDIEILILN